MVLNFETLRTDKGVVSLIVHEAVQVFLTGPAVSLQTDIIMFFWKSFYQLLYLKIYAYMYKFHFFLQNSQIRGFFPSKCIHAKCYYWRKTFDHSCFIVTLDGWIFNPLISNAMFLTYWFQNPTEVNKPLCFDLDVVRCSFVSLAVAQLLLCKVTTEYWHTLVTSALLLSLNGKMRTTLWFIPS